MTRPEPPTAGRPLTSRRPRPTTTEPRPPFWVDYVSGDRIAVDHPQPTARRQRDHDRDGRPPDRGRREDRRPHRRPRRVLTGAGQRAFSVGSDLRQRKNMTKEDWLRQRQDFDRTLYTVRQLRKPIFAAVNGIAYGGGSELAQSTDFIIASDNASFGQPEAMIGLAAGGGSPVFLPRLLPPGRALQMLMTGDPITAQEAHRLGMVNEIHPQAELMAARRRSRTRSPATHRPRCRRSSRRSDWARVSRSSRRSRS